MADWARDVNAYNHNLIALGDFNIERHGDPLYEALCSTGLHVPEELQHLPRTIFGSAGKQHHYDQIAWFTDGSALPALDLEYTRRGGIFDFVPYVMRGKALPRHFLEDLRPLPPLGGVPGPNNPGLESPTGRSCPEMTAVTRSGHSWPPQTPGTRPPTRTGAAPEQAHGGRLGTIGCGSVGGMGVASEGMRWLLARWLILTVALLLIPAVAGADPLRSGPGLGGRRDGRRR